MLTWQIADRQYSHSLPLDAPVSEVTELVEICIASQALHNEHMAVENNRIRGDAVSNSWECRRR
ncbi:hypothetical protein [Arthrobacter sp. efr-133-TYG-118]|uniref:hypothetical protein n=1 Tax=Arthrobacter sp. efr-133-TYG-118 TaxID=3040279 RepID=UPI00254CA25A|nr:hypothetical protein [Arthrobacter sp. efr-133-TYG-118]